MGGMKINNNLLEENILLKKRKIKIDLELLKINSEINEKLTTIINLLSTIQLPQTIIRENIPATKQSIKNLKHDKPFIPTSGASEYKSNMTTIKKRKRNTNLSDAVDKLSELE